MMPLRSMKVHGSMIKPMMTKMRNIPLNPKALNMNPPISGPRSMPRPNVASIMPMFLSRFSSSKEATMAIVDAEFAPEPMAPNPAVRMLSQKNLVDSVSKSR